MDQTRAPLFEALQQFVARNPLSFHVPGHKSGQIFPEGARHLLPNLSIDLTELPGLDDLHAPTGAIAEAEQLAANLYGAESTSFLVGGSTVGMLAFILGTCDANDLVIVDRNVHKSVIHGLQLAEAQAVFVETDTRDGIPLGPNQQQMLRAIAQFPQAKAIILTRPTYYGTVSEIKEIIAEAQKKNMVVCVDEAHGAHFGLHPALPKSAIQLGADVVVQSTHKMLPALTMAAMLHMQGSRAAKQRIQQHLRMLQSSSPSYLLMASMDLARRYAAIDGPAQIEQSIANITAFLLLNKQPLQDDPFKWVLHDPSGARTGFELYNAFVQRGIYPEMADAKHVVFYFGLHTDRAVLIPLQDALTSICGMMHRCELPEQIINQPTNHELPVTKFHRHASTQPSKAIDIEHAVGARSAEFVIPYPPGVAILIPGETITDAHVQTLMKCRKAKAHVQGVADATLNTIRIFREEDIR